MHHAASREPMQKLRISLLEKNRHRGKRQLRRQSCHLALGVLLLLPLPSSSPAQQLLPWQASPLASGSQRLDLSEVKTGPLAKIGGTLISLSREYEGAISGRSPGPFVPRIPLVQVKEERVTIDAVAETSASALQAKLEALGLQNGVSFGALVSGQLPISALPAAAALAELRFARPAMSTTNVGSVTSQGDPAQHSDDLRSMFPTVTGSGITVGTLSDSYDCLGGGGGAAVDVGTNDLPAGISVRMELTPCGMGTDEGRAMMQLIADVAPGASQAFHTAGPGQAGFASGINDLATVAGAEVIVDDVIFFAEPMFQDGVVAQAVDSVKAMGVAYFSSAGNNGRDAHESAYRPGIDPVFGFSAHDFDPGLGTDFFQQFTFPGGTSMTIVFQWDQPFVSATGMSGSASDVDLFILTDPPTGFVTASTDNNLGGDAVEVLTVTNSGATATFNLFFNLFAGPAPSVFKYVIFGSATVNEFFNASGSLYGHANAAGAEAVGAAAYFSTPDFGVSPPLLESFSSAGPMTIRFDLMDMPIMETRAKPNIVAPDGGNTTFLGTDIVHPTDPDSFPNFFGTSAAAPHAAGVAALLLDQANLTPSGVCQVLEASATDMGPAGFDDDSGYGLINALKAAQSTAPVSAVCGVDDLTLDGTPNFGS